MHRSARARGVGSLDMTAGEKRRRTQEPHRRRARPTSPPRDPSAAARGSSAAASGGCGQWSAEVTPPRRETHAGCAQERERRGLQGDRRCGGERRRGATGSPSEDCDPKHGEGDTTRGRRTEDSGPFGVRQGFRWTRPSRMGRARAALGTSHPEAHQRVQIHWRGGRSRTAAIGAHPTGGGRRSGGAAGAVRVCANARPSNGSAPPRWLAVVWWWRATTVGSGGDGVVASTPRSHRVRRSRPRVVSALTLRVLAAIGARPTDSGRGT